MNTPTLKRRKMVVCALAFLGMFLAACNFSQTSYNNSKDIAEAKEFTVVFYMGIKNKDWTKIVSSTSDSLISQLGAEGMKKQFYAVQHAIGDFKEFHVSSTETERVIENGIKTTRYKLTSYVKYKDGNTIEILKLVKNGEEKIKINGYTAKGE